MEIAVANINWRKQVEKAKRDAANDDEAIATMAASDKNKKRPSKKRAIPK